MTDLSKHQHYRAGVGALILNDKQEILMVQNNNYRDNEWDFVKGGMHEGETDLDTIKREIFEELGPDFKYEVIRKSSWNIIYEWTMEMQKDRGYRGQARVSYWVKYTGGEIELNTEELRKYKWISINELEEFLKGAEWTEGQIRHLILDLSTIQKSLFFA